MKVADPLLNARWAGSWLDVDASCHMATAFGKCAFWEASPPSTSPLPVFNIKLSLGDSHQCAGPNGQISLFSIEMREIMSKHL